MFALASAEAAKRAREKKLTKLFPKAETVKKQKTLDFTVVSPDEELKRAAEADEALMIRTGTCITPNTANSCQISCSISHGK